MDGAPRRTGIRWPGGARFAWTVFDDTDHTTLANGPPVYDVLTDLGLRTTKSVWPVAPHGPPREGGDTCEDPSYRRWCERLQDEGHEIGFHNATDHPSPRDRTIAALDRFRDIFGRDPRVGADHAGNREALYWGPHRLSGLRAEAYRRFSTATRPRGLAPGEGDPDDPYFSGHLPTSPYFWGDVARERIDYWRNFTFARVDLLGPCPTLPYHDPARPFVNWWYAATHAPTLDPLLRALHPDRLDRLEESGGVCIIYTHLGVDAAPGGRVDPRLAPALEHLAGRDGWFAPVSEVLDHLRAEGRAGILDVRARARLERRWVLDHARTRAAPLLRRRLARSLER